MKRYFDLAILMFWGIVLNFAVLGWHIPDLVFAFFAAATGWVVSLIYSAMYD